jgi:hypothetical protein
VLLLRVARLYTRLLVLNLSTIPMPLMLFPTLSMPSADLLRLLVLMLSSPAVVSSRTLELWDLKV